MTAWTCTFVEKLKLSCFFYNESEVLLLKRRNLWRVMYSKRYLSAHHTLPSQSSWLWYQNKTKWIEDENDDNECMHCGLDLKSKTNFPLPGKFDLPLVSVFKRLFYHVSKPYVQMQVWWSNWTLAMRVEWMALVQGHMWGICSLGLVL